MTSTDYTQLLPPEVLTKIFKLCMPQGVIDLHCSPSRSEAPLLLTKVSSRWRTIAYATPTLWNHISLEIINDGGGEFYTPFTPNYDGRWHKD